jgi:hypothetical protein
MQRHHHHRYYWEKPPPPPPISAIAVIVEPGWVFRAMILGYYKNVAWVPLA